MSPMRAIQSSLVTQYRIAVACYCVLPPAHRKVVSVTEVAAGIVERHDRTLRPLKERAVEEWIGNGAMLEGVEWMARPWRVIAADYESGALALTDMLAGTGVEPLTILEGVEGLSDSPGISTVLRIPPQTKAAWRVWLQEGLAPATNSGIIVLADAAMTAGHICPLDWTWELWCLANGKSDDGLWRQLSDEEMQLQKPVLLHSSRGGMKTMGLAAVVFSLCWFIPRYSACHAAAEKHQASQCLEYLRGWIQHPHFASGIVKDTGSKIHFKNNSVLFLVTATEKGLNSDHTLWFSCDEVELLDYRILLEGLRIPMEQAGRSLPSVTVLASTQKKVGMTMALLIEKALGGDYRYFLWNCFDVVEPCPEWRTKNLPPGLECKDYAKWTSVASELAGETDGYSKALWETAGTRIRELEANCSLCPHCRGVAKQGAGHYKIKDILKALADDIEQFRAQMLCQRPSPIGAVYPMFGAENVTEDAIYRPGQHIVGLCDYGYATDPAAGNLMCLNGPFKDVFIELHERGIQAYQQAEMYAQWQKRYRVEVWYVDGSARELITEMRKRKMTVVAVKSRDISRGIELVSRWICDAKNFRALRIHPDCRETILEMQSYELSPQTNRPKMHQPDHHADNIRYGAEGLGKGHKVKQIRDAEIIGSSPGRSNIVRFPPPGDERVE